MRLKDLNPRFLDFGGPDILGPDGLSVPLRTGAGIIFRCPCGAENELFIPFSNPIDGGPSIGMRGWERTGTTFDDLTLSPSIQRMDCCRWHGWIRGGLVVPA